jgi:quinol monooxygenase YgiN
MGHVFWWVELSVRPGCLDDFEKLTGEMVAATSTETGVLAYRRFIGADQRTVYVNECYENSEAAVAHLRKFAAIFSKRYGALVERKRFLVFGEPSDELRAMLDNYGAIYHRPLGRFLYRG